MRLFFALSPDSATRAALKALHKELVEAVSHDPKAEKVLRFTAPRSYHWTLRFLGDVPISELPNLIEVGDEVSAACSALTFHIDKPLRLGSRRQPILCLGSPENDDLQGLFNALEASLTSRAFPPADRLHFRPHLTLARQKAPQRGLIPKLEGIIKKHWRAQSCSIDSIQLMKSQLAPSGSVYSLIRDFELRPSV